MFWSEGVNFSHKILNFGNKSNNGILFIEVPREEGDPKPTVKDAHYYNFNDMDSLLDLFDDRWEILKKLIQGKNDCRLKIVIRKRSMEE